jgi:GR25 family glycosyltransferase involved in LPS biosynthesis
MINLPFYLPLVLCFFVILLLLCHLTIQKVQQRLPYPTSTVSALCINLFFRREQWEYIRQQCQSYNIDVERLPACYGPYLQPDTLIQEGLIADKLTTLPLHLRGHLGTLMSHKMCYKLMVSQQRGLTLILEDDALLDLGELSNRLHSIRHLQWDVLLLGFSCHNLPECQKNPREFVAPGVIPLHYFVGLWAYVVRSAAVAQKLLDYWPLHWAWDHQMNHVGLRIWGCLPHLAHHPGHTQVDVWNYHHRHSAPRKYISDNTM